MSRPVSRILSPVRTGGRPSIWAHRRRVPRAVHPQARASSPRTPAQPHREVRSSTLLRAGFTEPPRSPGALVRSYRTVSPLPHGPRGPWAVCFLWHCPAGHPGLPLATALLCGVRTFLDTERGTTPVPVPGVATARPTHPPQQNTRSRSAAVHRARHEPNPPAAATGVPADFCSAGSPRHCGSLPPRCAGDHRRRRGSRTDRLGRPACCGSRDCSRTASRWSGGTARIHRHHCLSSRADSSPPMTTRYGRCSWSVSRSASHREVRNVPAGYIYRPAHPSLAPS